MFKLGENLRQVTERCRQIEFRAPVSFKKLQGPCKFQDPCKFQEVSNSANQNCAVR